MSTGKEHKLLNLGSYSALMVPKLTVHDGTLAMEGVGHRRPPGHVAGQGHCPCLLPSLAVPGLLLFTAVLPEHAMLAA